MTVLTGVPMACLLQAEPTAHSVEATAAAITWQEVSSTGACRVQQRRQATKGRCFAATGGIGEFSPASQDAELAVWHL